MGIAESVKQEIEDLGKREPTSLKIDGDLWREVRKMAIDKRITATEYLEQALKEKLDRDKHDTDRFEPHTA